MGAHFFWRPPDGPVSQHSWAHRNCTPTADRWQSPAPPAAPHAAKCRQCNASGCVAGHHWATAVVDCAPVAGVPCGASRPVLCAPPGRPWNPMRRTPPTPLRLCSTDTALLGLLALLVIPFIAIGLAMLYLSKRAARLSTESAQYVLGPYPLTYMQAPPPPSPSAVPTPAVKSPAPYFGPSPPFR